MSHRHCFVEQAQEIALLHLGGMDPAGAGGPVPSIQAVCSAGNDNDHIPWSVPLKTTEDGLRSARSVGGLVGRGSWVSNVIFWWVIRGNQSV